LTRAERGNEETEEQVQKERGNTSTRRRKPNTYTYLGTVFIKKKLN
jgi:hypothetical protein